MHYSFGISILFITLVRIALRFYGPEPVLAPAPPAWQALLARLIHLALYAFMIAMPLLAWLY